MKNLLSNIFVVLIPTIVIIVFLHLLWKIFPCVKKGMLWLLHNLILLVAILYMMICINELEIFLSANTTNDNEFLYIATHSKTHSSVVNFFALLTFYQLLADRYQSMYSKPFKKLSTLNVITQRDHNLILKNEIKKLRDNHRRQKKRRNERTKK